MINTDQIRDILGRDVQSSDGQKIGRAGQVYLDDQTQRPEWVTVLTGLFGTKETFVPLADADFTGGELVVPYDKNRVKGAPNVDADGGHLSPDDEAELYRYYGLDDSAGMTGVADQTYADQTYADRTDDRTYSAGDTGRDEAMTRSEEQLRAGTEKVAAGKARLRKWVETEDVQVSVPVRREKAVLETEQITDANRDEALAGSDFTESEHEVTLTEERPVVQKETVPVERVRLGKEVQEDTETVSDTVRKERVAAEGDVDGSGETRR